MKRITAALLTFAIAAATFCGCSDPTVAENNTVTLYSPTEIKEVHLTELENYSGDEWATSPMCRMYSADGRALAVKISDIAAFKEVGWYLDPVVTVYSPDGRSMVIPWNELAQYGERGWYSKPIAFGETPDLYLASPATNEDFIRFANQHAEELNNYYDAFAYGFLFEANYQNEITGPKHQFGNIWYEISDSKIKSYSDLENEWYRHFSKDTDASTAFGIYTEIDGKPCVAQLMGLGVFVSSVHQYTSIKNISETEVHVIGKISSDFDGDGDISNNPDEDISDTVFVLVLEDGKWKCKLS